MSTLYPGELHEPTPTIPRCKVRPNPDVIFQVLDDEAVLKLNLHYYNTEWCPIS
jgi:hypothetical protein